MNEWNPAPVEQRPTVAESLLEGLSRPLSRSAWILSVALVVLGGVTLAWIAGVPLAARLGTTLLLALALFTSSTDCGRLLFLALPFFNVIGMDLGGTSSFYVLVILFTVKSLMDGTIERPRMWLFLVLLVFVLTAYNAPAGSSYLRWLINVTVFITLLTRRRSREDLAVQAFLLSLSLTLSSLLGLIMMRSGGLHYAALASRADATSATRFSALIGDAVVYGVLLCVAIALNTHLVLVGQARRGTAPLTYVLAFFVFVTYSKGALVSLVIIGVVGAGSVTVRLVRDAFPAKGVAFGLIGMLGAWAASRLLLVTDSFFSLQFLQQRLEADDLLTARRQIWEGYFHLWRDWGAELLVRGVGFDTYRETKVYGQWHNTHNLYIEAITLFGVIPALLLFGALLVLLVRRAVRGVPFTAFLPCVVVLAEGMIVHGFLDFPSFFEWALALMAITVGGSSHSVRSSARGSAIGPSLSDGGSTDNTLELHSSCASRDARIRLFSQENAGHGVLGISALNMCAEPGSLFSTRMITCLLGRFTAKFIGEVRREGAPPSGLGGRWEPLERSLIDRAQLALARGMPSDAEPSGMTFHRQTRR